MKTRWTFLMIVVSLLALLLLESCGPGKYTEQTNEELYGTWINESYSGNITYGTYTPQKSVIAPGTFSDYDKITSQGPHVVGKNEITGKWKDTEGNIWYKIQGSGANGDKVLKWQTLTKLSKSATVEEFASTTVEKYDPNSYPTKIDPKDKDYRIYYRAKE